MKKAWTLNFGPWNLEATGRTQATQSLNSVHMWRFMVPTFSHQTHMEHGVNWCNRKKKEAMD